MPPSFPFSRFMRPHFHEEEGLASDEEIQNASSKCTDEAILGVVREIAEKMGFSEPFEVRTSSKETASAQQSRTGKLYLIVDPTLPLEDLRAILPHEIAHLKNGDTSKASLDRAHRDRDYEQRLELRADVASEVMCQGQRLRDILQSHLHDPDLLDPVRLQQRIDALHQGIESQGYRERCGPNKGR